MNPRNPARPRRESRVNPRDTLAVGHYVAACEAITAWDQAVEAALRAGCPLRYVARATLRAEWQRHSADQCDLDRDPQRVHPHGPVALPAGELLVVGWALPTEAPGRARIHYAVEALALVARRPLYGRRLAHALEVARTVLASAPEIVAVAVVEGARGRLVLVTRARDGAQRMRAIEATPPNGSRTTAAAGDGALAVVC